ncbi:MAG: hypothetical protein E6I57_05685 [Chloroflexi bacterium]|nr:MAG: hypothetical protein E6J38_10595 [Chloroflexota bacterium]TMC28992.1 MAG: hypothetical protein E6J27_06675 [Chloroflexota bacterium]TMC35662.1 MAG: hypothetical protein E6J24_03720 [Chloroflexota bacterium]TMC52487.1 MAG: hypothetical protein E6J19_15745 [Chloroflexota bacterium]TME40266.1 MAG: hypothetical protein E6I57_05685 [Chloroflexota bacterium]
MTAAAIRRLGDEALAREPSLGTLLGRLADAVDDGRATEAEGYIGAIDARGLAELLAGAHSRFWAVLEVLRNVLVFAPIAVTWFGLSLAAGAYADMLAARPELVSQPFLLLWEQGFGGRLLFNFGTLALIDASLIGILILLSFTLHLRSELTDVAFQTSVLLKESEIRAVLGQASSLGALDVSGPDAEAILADMAAEERRIYERASEREGELFSLEGVVNRLAEAAARLERAADAIARR